MKTFGMCRGYQNNSCACAEMSTGSFAMRQDKFDDNMFMRSADLVDALFFCVLSLLAVLCGLICVLVSIIIVIIAVVVRIIKPKLNMQSRSEHIISSVLI